MLTYAPLPDLKGIGKALVSWRPGSHTPIEPWCGEGETAGWLARSAWSLALIARWRGSQGGAEPITVWVPGYFCNESLDALRKCGVRLVFYPLTDQFAPDIQACKSIAQDAPPDVFLCVHYFGRATPAAPARDFCKKHDAWLVEDAAHVLVPQGGVGSWGDFVLYSPHKLLPIPDGAILVARPDGPAAMGPEGVGKLGNPAGWPDQLADLGRALVDGGAGGMTRTLRWFIKRSLQRAGIRARRSAYAPFNEATPTDRPLGLTMCPPHMSGLARALIPGLVPDLAEIGERRRRHALLWDALAASDGAESSAVPELLLDRIDLDWIPYLAGYRVASPGAEATYQKWQELGLPVSTWPDLPPEVTSARQLHSHAWSLRHSSLHLATHQSFSALAMVKAANQARLRSKAAENGAWEWDRLEREQWDRLLSEVGQSNALQSWAYGDAKQESEGWTVRRGVFRQAGQPRAIVQLLQKRLAGGLRVSRINRGPLFLSSPNSFEREAVWSELCLLGDWRRLRALVIAPEVPLSGASLVLLARLGLRQRSGQGWSSAWIGLSDDLAELRKRQNGKWRNMLVSAEKAGLEWSVDRSAEAFAWMVGKQQELMEERDFIGPPPDLLRRWASDAVPDAPMAVLRATENGEPVAGVCLAFHGSAATYLLGWNGARARQLRASHFLIWQSIVYLKEAGVEWFDLGGIDEKDNPGIAKFKLGAGGERYDLAGEYVKW